MIDLINSIKYLFFPFYLILSYVTLYTYKKRYFMINLCLLYLCYLIIYGIFRLPRSPTHGKA